MRINVVGGGPAGLLFAFIAKRERFDVDVVVYEQNAPDETYGFGIGLSANSIRFMRAVDPGLHDAMIALMEPLPTLSLRRGGELVRINGQDFGGIERVRLLDLLRRHAAAAGASFVDGKKVDSFDQVADADLIVGADGANSIIRRSLQERLSTQVHRCRNKWVWYASSRTTDGIELLFEQTAAGLFIGHTYRYRPDRNTFVVECSPQTWRMAGLDEMTEADSIAYCNDVFSDFLGGHSLISNRSYWFTPRIVRNNHWSSGSTTLIGDAQKTMHPSIGSGTRAAMQDAIALARALSGRSFDVEGALCEYEETRRPAAEALQASALKSIAWYESIESQLDRALIDLSYDYMMRTGRLSEERLAAMDPAFVADYQRYAFALAARSNRAPAGATD